MEANRLKAIGKRGEADREGSLVLEKCFNGWSTEHKLVKLFIALIFKIYSMNFFHESLENEILLQVDNPQLCWPPLSPLTLAHFLSYPIPPHHKASI